MNPGEERGAGLEQAGAHEALPTARAPDCRGGPNTPDPAPEAALGKGPDAGAPAPAPALPCLSSNDSNGGEGTRRLTSYDKRRAEMVFMTIAGLITRHTVNRLVFITLTFPQQLRDRRAAHRRWNSFASGWFRERHPEYCLVWERHKRGGLHLHIVAAVPFDARAGFDFASWDRARRESFGGRRGAAFWAATRAYGASASPELRAMWADLGEAAKRYKFGRANCLPIKKDGDALGRYLAKYLTKGNGNSTFPREDKGKRRVDVSRAARVATVHFQRLNPHSWVWREKFKVWAASRGCASPDAVKAIHGSQYMKWARVQIHETVLLESTVFPTKSHAIAAGADVTGLPDTSAQISGARSAPVCFHPSENERKKRVFVQMLGQEAGLKLWRDITQSSWVGKESEEMLALRAARHERAKAAYHNQLAEVEAERASTLDLIQGNDEVQLVIEMFGGNVIHDHKS